MDKENTTLGVIASLTPNEPELLRKRFGILNRTDDATGNSDYQSPDNDDENVSGGVSPTPSSFS